MPSLLLSSFLIVSQLALSSLPASLPRCLPSTSGALTINLLDVGQGEAIVISCPGSNRVALIDAGTTNDLYPGAEQLFDGELSAVLVSKKLELALNTHPHPDHIAGFTRLLDKAKNQKHSTFLRPEPVFSYYFDNGADDQNSQLEEQLRKQLANNGVTYINLSLSSQDRIEICPQNSSFAAVNLDLFLPDQRLSDSLGCPSNLNDCSVVSALSFQGVVFFFLADATLSWEKHVLKTKRGQRFLQRRPDTATVVLKLGHHGSDSTSSELLQQIAPDLALLSTGRPGLGTTEKYGYPEQDVIARVTKYFHRSSGASDIATREIRTCSKTPIGKCVWQKTKAADQILTTADHGTISLHVQNGKLCTGEIQ